MNVDFRDSLPEGRVIPMPTYVIRYTLGDDQADARLFDEDNGELPIGTLCGEKLIEMLKRSLGELVRKQNTEDEKRLLNHPGF